MSQPSQAVPRGHSDFGGQDRSHLAPSALSRLVPLRPVYKTADCPAVPEPFALSSRLLSHDRDFVTTRNTACCYSEGISMRSPHGLHSNSTCLAPTDVTRCLRTRTPVPEMTGQSPRKRLGVSRHKNRGRAFLVIRAGPLDLIPRIPGAVRLWSKWARASRNTLLELHDTGGTDEQPSQLRSCPGRPRCDPAR
jgi:hypothetical protein